MDRTTRVAIHHDPPIWIDENPVDGRSGNVNFNVFNNEVIRGKTESGIEYRASVDGAFSFDFSNWEIGRFPDHAENDVPEIDKLTEAGIWRMIAINAFLCFLYTRVMRNDKRMLYRMVATPTDEIVVDKIDMSGSKSFAAGSRSHYISSARYHTSYSLHGPLFDQRLMHRSLVSREAVEGAFKDFSLAFSRGKEDLVLLELFLRGSKAYQDHHHSLSVIHSWAVIEKLISLLWVELIAENECRDGRPFIVGGRKKTLRDDHRSYTAAVKIEILSIAGKISMELYEDLSTARKSRNDWMHNLGSVDRSHAEAARSACEELLSSVKGYAVNGASPLSAHF